MTPVINLYPYKGVVLPHKLLLNPAPKLKYTLLGISVKSPFPVSSTHNERAGLVVNLN